MNLDALTNYLPKFLFILLRAGIVLVLLPFFGSKEFPAQVKIGFAVAIAIVLTPVVEINVPKGAVPITIVRELILGMAFAFSARFLFYALEMTGQMISNAMGLSIANIFNPDMGQTTEVSQILVFIAMLLFLATDSHHELIYMFVRSYEWLPVGQVSIGNIVPAIISLGSTMFVIALKLSAPVVLTMVISHIILGFVYKAAPQINIFFVAYPIYIFVGLVVILIGMPVLISVMGGYLGSMRDEMSKVLATMRS